MRGTRAVWGLLLVVGASAAIESAALAKGGIGSFFGWNRSLYGVGEVARGEATVLLPTLEDARRVVRDQGYYAYLVPGAHFATRFPPPAAERILVGPVTLRPDGANFVEATGRFIIPEVAPGSYSAVICDLGCAEPLGDLLPARLRIVASGGEARITRRLATLSRRVTNRLVKIRELEQRLEEEMRLLDIRSVSRERTTRTHFLVTPDELDARLKEVSRSETNRATGEFIPWFVAGAASVALAGTVLRRDDQMSL